MQILPINSCDRSTKNNNFKANLVVTKEAEQAVRNVAKFKNVMKSFRNKIKPLFPLNATVTIDSRDANNAIAYYKGSYSYHIKTDNNPYRPASGPLVTQDVFEKENLSMKLEDGKCGFLFNDNDDEKQILEDLMIAFRSIRARSGIQPSLGDQWLF